MTDANKNIHFYTDNESLMTAMVEHSFQHTYQSTKSAIDEGLDEIHSTSLLNMDIGLVNKGYDIYYHKANKTIHVNDLLDYDMAYSSCGQLYLLAVNGYLEYEHDRKYGK